MNEFDKMLQLLDAAWLLRSEIVPCLVGPPGIGKTTAVEQHAKAHGCGKVVKIVASRCVPSETVGMTMPDHKNKSMDIYNSMQLSSLEDGDILFLDELLEADQFVLSTLLTVIESREMADGTPLPDIQIIAATNDTIPPEQLKGNIRQRFMFQRFSVDKVQVRDYIEEKTGFKLSLPILDMLTDKGGSYNFLTPRSLTKLCLWIDAADGEDQESHVAQAINNIWCSSIGTELLNVKRNRDLMMETPEVQARKAVKQIVMDMHLDDDEHINFDDCTMNEMLELLKDMPEWEEIARRLVNIEVKEHKENEVDIAF